MSRRIALIAAILLLLLGVLLFFAPHPVYAHENGLTLTSTTTNYLVDVDYETFVIAAGLPGRFTLRLFRDAERQQPVDFTQVFARITRDNEYPDGRLIFSGWIAKGMFGSTGFSTALAEVGSYKLTVRYNNGDTELVEATMPFEVVPAVKDDTWFHADRNFWVGFGICGAIAGVLAAAYILWRRVIRRQR